MNCDCCSLGWDMVQRGRMLAVCKRKRRRKMCLGNLCIPVARHDKYCSTSYIHTRMFTYTVHHNNTYTICTSLCLVVVWQRSILWASREGNFNVVQKTHLSMYGLYILRGVSKGTFKIRHKISYSYIENCRFYPQVKIEEHFDLRAPKCFWILLRHKCYCFEATQAET